MLTQQLTKNTGLWCKQSCQTCIYQKLCMGVSWLGRYRPRAFVMQRNLLMRVESSPKQRQGTESHAQLAEKRGVEAPMPEEACNRIRAGERLLFTQAFCSKLYRLYCHPDAVEIQIDGETVNISITEDKANYRSEDWLQLLAEGLILSDPKVMAGDLYLFDRISDMPLKVNIKTTLVPYMNPKYAIAKDFVREGSFVDKALVMAVLKRRNKYADLFHVTNWQGLPLCPSCKEDATWCGFWPVCCEHVPKPTKQTKLGSFGVRKRRYLTEEAKFFG